MVHVSRLTLRIETGIGYFAGGFRSEDRHMIDVRVVHYSGQSSFSVTGRKFVSGVFFPKSGEIWFPHGRGLYAANCV